MSPSNHTLRENLGIIVQYKVKIKLLLGTLSGELVAELPFTLTHPKPPDSPRRERDLRNGREGPNQIAKDGTLITEGTGENSAMDTSNTLPKDDDVDLMRFDRFVTGHGHGILFILYPVISYTALRLFLLVETKY